MNILTNRFVAASLIGLVGVSGVQAQTAVLNFQQYDGAATNKTIVGDVWSQFKFTESMSVTSIGFVWSSNFNDYADFTWSLNGVNQGSRGLGSLTQGANDIVWWDLASGVQVNNGDTLRIYNQVTNSPSGSQPNGNYANIDSLETLESNVQGVTYEGMTENGGSVFVPAKANGNIKVQNPGSNVAPEPGTFALALTGGGALLGMYVRRRRMAA